MLENNNIVEVSGIEVAKRGIKTYNWAFNKMSIMLKLQSILDASNLNQITFESKFKWILGFEVISVRIGHFNRGCKNYRNKIGKDNSHWILKVTDSSQNWTCCDFFLFCINTPLYIHWHNLYFSKIVIWLN